MKRTTDEMLQDYLDGRLDNEARAEFEALMESDPELAERVESYRGIGQALRDEEPELSPGFYSRARARFEESGRGKMRMPRLLSWEAAGLATAAALACVLFVPYLLDRDRKGDELPPTETTWEAPPAAPALEEEKKEIEFAPMPTAEEDLDDTMMPEDEKMEKSAAPPPLPSVRADAVPAEPRREKGDKKRAREVAMGQAVERERLVGPSGIYFHLHPGVVEPGTVTILETEDEWRPFAEKNELDRMQYDPDQRWVLIGAREFSFQCNQTIIEKLESSYRITLRPPTDPRLADKFGCAVIVGNDHRTIEVLPPLEEQR